MKSILIGLLMLNLTAFCQSSIPNGGVQIVPTLDSVYCLPISKARLLIADAIRLSISDTMIANLSNKAELLGRQNIAQYNSFTNLLKISEQKYQTQKEITTNMESWGNSWRDQATYYQKKDRKHRREKKGLMAGIAILIGVIIVK